MKAGQTTLLVACMACALTLTHAGRTSWAQTPPEHPTGTLWVWTQHGHTQVSTTPPERDHANVRIIHPQRVAPAATPPRSSIDPALIEWAILAARRAGLEPALVCAVVEVESSWQIWATSERGAAGLMQITEHLWNEYNLENPWDPQANLEVGALYLAELKARYHGRLDWALAAYNAGSGNVRAHNGPPSYTQVYIRAVLRHRQTWRALLDHR